MKQSCISDAHPILQNKHRMRMRVLCGCMMHIVCGCIYESLHVLSEFQHCQPVLHWHSCVCFHWCKFALMLHTVGSVFSSELVHFSHFELQDRSSTRASMTESPHSGDAQCSWTHIGTPAISQACSEYAIVSVPQPTPMAQPTPVAQPTPMPQQHVQPQQPPHLASVAPGAWGQAPGAWGRYKGTGVAAAATTTLCPPGLTEKEAVVDPWEGVTNVAPAVTNKGSSMKDDPEFSATVGETCKQEGLFVEAAEWHKRMFKSKTLSKDYVKDQYITAFEQCDKSNWPTSPDSCHAGLWHLALRLSEWGQQDKLDFDLVLVWAYNALCLKEMYNRIKHVHVKPEFMEKKDACIQV